MDNPIKQSGHKPPTIFIVELSQLFLLFVPSLAKLN